MLRKIKDRLYYYFAEKNWGVRREYGPYVDAHQTEHAKQPWKHWWLLVRLNWHYRVLRRETWMIVPTSKKSGRRPYLNGSESAFKRPAAPQHFVKSLLEYDVISFDVFDTLIFRPFSSPTTIFSLLQAENGIRHFAELRKTAEKEMRIYNDTRLGTREVTLKEIYQYMEPQTGLNVDLAVEAEIAMERRICFANPYMKAVYDMLRAYGKRIIIVSDMYLPTAAVADILQKNGFTGYEKLYVSGDLRINKATGALYDAITQELGGELRYIHVGDNPHSDVNMAQKAGWNTKRYQNVNTLGNPFRAEKMSPIMSSAYAGIVNTHLHNGMRVYSPQYEYGFIYGGIYVLGYVNWIHEYALLHNLDKVIFLARDGNIYKKVYDSLYTDIPSAYMYWSRAATIRYDLKNNRPDFLKRVVRYRMLNKTSLTMQELLGQIGAEILISKLPQYQLNNEDLLTEENEKIVEQLLIDSMNLLSDVYEKQSNDMCRYVEAIIGTAQNVAIVDVGWAGTGPESLKKIIEKDWALNCSVDCLLAASSVDTIQLSQTNVYAFSALLNRDHFVFHFSPRIRDTSNLLFEFFTQSTEPSFLGFYENEFRFSSPTPEGYQYVKEIHNGIFDFCREFKRRVGIFPALMHISGYDAYCPFRMILGHLIYFIKVFGAFPIEPDTGGSLARPQSLVEYFKKREA